MCNRYSLSAIAEDKTGRSRSFFLTDPAFFDFGTLYLTNRFTGRPPKEEPLNHFMQLIEFAFE